MFEEHTLELRMERKLLKLASLMRKIEVIDPDDND
jgi:hypothetical protein